MPDVAELLLIYPAFSSTCDAAPQHARALQQVSCIVAPSLAHTHTHCGNESVGGWSIAFNDENHPATCMTWIASGAEQHLVSRQAVDSESRQSQGIGFQSPPLSFSARHDLRATGPVAEVNHQQLHVL